MTLDMGDFVGQIIPIIIAFLMIPALILTAYFLIRFFLRRQRGEQAAKNEPEPSATTAPDALSLLRSASPPAERRAPAAEEELPDLDLLMNSIENAPPQVSTPQKSPDGRYQVTLNTGQTGTAKEELIILRDEQDGRLIVQIGDTAYRSLKHETTTRQKFTALMKELSKVIMTEDETSAAIPPAETPVVERPMNSIPVATAPAEDIAPQETPARSTTPPPPAYDGMMPGDLPSYKFDDNPAKIQSRRFSNPKVEFDAPPELDIASAIEAYLQHKIRHTPEFHGRNIHIHSAPGGGVRIEVDGTYYDFVNEVADPTTRVFIQESIAEWQERQ